MHTIYLHGVKSMKMRKHDPDNDNALAFDIEFNDENERGVNLTLFGMTDEEAQKWTKETV